MTFKVNLGVLAILASAFCVTTAHAVLVDKIAAVVNNEVILQSDIERFERTVSLRKELDPLFGFSADIEGAKASRSNILDFLIQEKLITQSFKNSDADVEQEVQGVQKSNNLDREQLVEFLKGKGFDFNEYFELMRVGLAKRTLLDREIRTRVNVSDDDVRNYFLNNVAKKSNLPLEYSIQIIAINNSSFKTQQNAQAAAESALRELRQGEPFAEVARRVSDDPSSQNGGDIGYFASDALAEPLKSAVRKLQIGSTSDVLKTPAGWMIVKLVDARSTESEALKQQKEQIREELAKEEYKKQLTIWAERSRNNAYVKIN